MSIRRGTGLLAMAALAGIALRAQPVEDETQQMDDVVITATLVQTPAHKLGQSITVISREQIDAAKLTYVTQLLQLVPGINIVSYGPNQNPTVRVRGLQAYHTKVLIDGVPYQDPSQIGVTPVLNELRTSDVERIEIVRGASSVVHGSNAIGGVINIITRSGKDEGKPVAGSVSAEYGSNRHQQYSGTLRGASGPVDYSLSANWIGENGISAMSAKDGINEDRDANRNASFSGRAGMDLSDNLRLEIFGRYSAGLEEYDSGFDAWDYSAWPPTYLGIVPDSGSVNVQNWLAGGKLAATELLDGLLDSSLAFSYTQTRRAHRDRIDPFGLGPESTAFKDRFTGDILDATWLNTLHLAEGYKLSLGINHARENAEIIDGGTATIDRDNHSWAYFGEVQAEPFENLFLTAGARYNDHSVFGGETTWSTSARYLLEATGTTLKAAAGKAYRAPSLYELYAPAVGSWWFKGGNPNLDPEVSQNWEVGFEQALLDAKVVFGSTYYESRVTDYIGWGTDVDFLSTYLQFSGVKVHGVESFIRVQPWQFLTVQLTHTYQHTNDMESDVADLPYRPKHMASLDVIYRTFGDRLTVNLNGSYVGTRHTGLGGTGTELDCYVLANLAVSYKINENLEVHGRIENLLNENYETIPGYNTYARRYFAGMTYFF